jgi:hypothetical protein
MTTTHPSANDSGLNLDRLDAMAPAASIAQHEEIERAVDARYPLQNSPHASVNDKIGAARLAFRNGYRAALADQPAPTDWQAAHADMVKRNALLRERPDLPADRIPAHAELVRLQEENARLRANQPAPTVPAISLVAKLARVSKWIDKFPIPTDGATAMMCLIRDVQETLAHQPAQEQAEPFKWPNGCDRMIPRALRYLANNPRPSGGEETFNGAHLYQLAGEMEAAARKIAAQQEPVAAPQQAAAPEQFCDANCVWTDHHKDCTISAPGTPEAPLDPGQVQSIADRVRNTAGIPRAAQLVGGQEGSD